MKCKVKTITSNWEMEN